MMELKGKRAMVVGLGVSGRAAARFLGARGAALLLTDKKADLATDGLPAGEIQLGGENSAWLKGVDLVVTSPGIPRDSILLREAQQRGIPVIGELELAYQLVKAPIIGITGTNGKSTVTSLVARMAAAAGRRVLAGGNLGNPALDLLEQPTPDLYVLELSSFQLETTTSLELLAAVVLNVTADHLDRYASVSAYARAKARIFAKASTVVLNADDPRVAAMRAGLTGVAGQRGAALRDPPRILTFSTQRPDSDFALLHIGDRIHLARRGEPVLDISRMKITGLHNAANALAALALGEAAGLKLSAMLEALETFPGLEHRSAWVADLAGVRYIDDSKGTNVGATLAAVSGLSGPLILIAGGQGKGQDFSPLVAAVRGKVRHAVLIGKDAAVVESALRGVCTTERAATMDAAVSAAAAVARPGDTVLLSPACASFDMFRDYAQRGDVFAAAVRALAWPPR